MLDPRKMKKWIGSSIVALTAMAGTAHAANVAPAQESNVTRAEYNELKAELARLRAQQDETWMNERRAEEIKGLVREVLSDAETRASLQASGATAGHDGKNFYLASADGAFLLQLSGHFQLRYIYNHRDAEKASGTDNDLSGFQLRRAKVKGKGHIGDPKIKYAFSIAMDPDSAASGEDSDALMEDYYIEYAFGDGWSVRGGRWKQPFARQNLVSSGSQLVMERSVLHETFRVDRSEGVMLTYAPKERNYRWNIALNNGRIGQGRDWDDTGVGTAVDISVTSRIEVLLAGSWSQFKDFSAWSNDETGLLFGAAVHYQEGETGGGSSAGNVLLATADLSYESNGLSIFIAAYSAHFEGNQDGTVPPMPVAPDDATHHGAEIVVGYFIVPDKTEVYTRLEYIRLDNDTPTSAGGPVMDEDVEILTVGVNFYQKKHNAKFTIDYVYAFDTLASPLETSASLGVKSDFTAPGFYQSGQHAIRAQYQLQW